MRVAELEDEAPAIRALGFLFKLTEVYLWDDASTEIRRVSPSIDYTILFQDDQNGSNTAYTITNFSPSPVDGELAEQMNAMGLPLSFHTNKERNIMNGGKRKNTKKKHLHGHQTIEDEALDSDKVSEGMITSHTIPYDNTSNSFSCKSMLGQSESSYCDIAVNVNEILPLSDKVEDSETMTASTCATVEKCVAGAGISGVVDCECALRNASSKDCVNMETSAIKMDDETLAGRYLAINGVDHVEKGLGGGLMESVCLGGLTVAEHDTEGKKLCSDAGVALTECPDISTSSQFPNLFDCDKIHGNCNGAFGDWKAYWDTFYMRNYFYNVKTQESTWIPPLGMEHLPLEDDASESKEMIVEVAEMEICPAVSIQYNEGIDPRSGLQHDMDASEESKDEDGSPEEPLKERSAGFGLAADNLGESTTTKRKKKVRRTRSRRKLSVDSEVLQFQGILEEFSPSIKKYWHQRYRLFSKFDEGIKMDEEGWFSVTPERIAKHHASRCGGGILVDFFTGVGGNAIQFAERCKHVIAIDIDSKKVDYAQNNAAIYGVADHIEFVKGNSFLLAPKLKADTVFLSPPWGGPDYAKAETYDTEIMLKPHGGLYLFNIARGIASRVVMFLPRNVDINQLAELSLSANPPWSLEVEKNFLNGKLKAITAYFSEPLT